MQGHSSRETSKTQFFSIIQYEHYALKTGSRATQCESEARKDSQLIAGMLWHLICEDQEYSFELCEQ